MTVRARSFEERLDALSELEHHFAHHDAWLERLHRTLVCRIPAEADITDEKAHCKCNLGRWLGDRGETIFGHDPRFAKILSAHEVMHGQARTLAAEAVAGRPIPPDRYDRFVEVLTALRTEIKALHTDLATGIVKSDPLTGAENRLWMRQRLEFEVAQAHASGEAVNLIMMDVDHFKRINDRFGHLFGDQVLAGIAESVTASVRAQDLFFRYGGEEFLLCIRHADLSAVMTLCERIRTTVEGLRFSGPQDEDVRVTASFGLAPLDPGTTLDGAIDNADRALYDAKAAGRNRVAIWDRPAA
ncbi:diguanylate cyclase [Polymorphum gilvum]|uniref:diguanylate cyclase n=1 Tax=Polymorphum gilvum (strain LMG 25793 / CGMCC 1.9160 / SL003B-26A1) TaxID=991905 RepID=F2J1G2_POLGS|nr:diguanylate cyclase [Polymorphum gilvum]ADZ69744.1 Diguanylate cyclase with PAS/PAC sensor [Polymorphum gilvum SL003B-26A1]